MPKPFDADTATNEEVDAHEQIQSENEAMRQRDWKPAGVKRERGREREFTDGDALYFTLRCFRMGIYPEKAAPDFGMCKWTAAALFKSTVRELAEVFRREIPRPTQQEVFDTTPEDFKEKSGLENIELILDATGVKFGKASNPELARWLCASALRNLLFVSNVLCHYLDWNVHYYYSSSVLHYSESRVWY